MQKFLYDISVREKREGGREERFFIFANLIFVD
jgi:hypothetical protein